MTKIDATKTFITYGLAFGLIALTAVAGAL
jgi:hypothetical protein